MTNTTPTPCQHTDDRVSPSGTIRCVDCGSYFDSVWGQWIPLAH